jgi:tRNA threonylcarbamoyl adenosine modification protein (Sua5/YciO/YrdC/YwlC family)
MLFLSSAGPAGSAAHFWDARGFATIRGFVQVARRARPFPPFYGAPSRVDSVLDCPTHFPPMAQYFVIHPENPQRRLIQQAAEIVRRGGLIVYPTDSCYALGCHLGDKHAQERIRAIRQVDEHHHFTLVCRDLSQISQYARVDNRAYRLLRATTPGSYTFILQATPEVPRRLQNPKRRTIGLRIPDHPVAQALLSELSEPLLSSTLTLPGDELPLNDGDEIRQRLEHQVDLVMDAGSCGIEMTTVVDLTGEVPEIVRMGKGSPEPFGVAA